MTVSCVPEMYNSGTSKKWTALTVHFWYTRIVHFWYIPGLHLQADLIPKTNPYENQYGRPLKSIAVHSRQHLSRLASTA